MLIPIRQYTNDEVFSTKAWAQASGVFSTRHVVHAERELLRVLCFDLHVSRTAVASLYAAVIARFRQSTIAHHAAAAYASRTPPFQHVLPIAASSRRPPPYAHHAVPSVSLFRRRSAASTVSSGSSSPLDSPELQTPPETYPRSVPSHAPSDPKWTHAPVSHVLPYVLANDYTSVAPQNPVSMSGYEEPHPYVLADPKSLGNVNAHGQPSLLAELYDDLDGPYVSHATNEVAPPTFPNYLPDISHPVSAAAPQYPQNSLPWADISHTGAQDYAYVF